MARCYHDAFLATLLALPTTSILVADADVMALDQGDPRRFPGRLFVRADPTP